MEEKKGTKTHRLLITFLIIIVLIILMITSFYIYLQISTTSVPDSKEVEITELKSQIQKLETELANANNSTSTQANTTEDSSSSEATISFSETMDMLYTKTGTQIEGSNCTNNPNDSIYMILEDNSQNITDVEYTTVGLYNGEILFNMHTANSDTSISKSITGISEEVVSIKILPSEEGAIPIAVYFLTRSGTVYYIDDTMINSNNFVAQRLEDLSEVVSIEVVNITYPGAMHEATSLIATTYDGEKINVLN